MVSGWRYRVASVAGTGGLTALAMTVANNPSIQRALLRLPVVDSLRLNILAGDQFRLALVTTVAVIVTMFIPLFRPAPRRILDTAFLAVRRLFGAMIALAAIGYFDYTYRLPRLTLAFSGALLLVWLPAWYVAIRRQPEASQRAVIIGDDPDVMEAVLTSTDMPVIGYVSSSLAQPANSPYADGGRTESVGAESPTSDRDSNADARNLTDLRHMGGLPRLDELLVKNDVDTALLAFREPGRAEFFGTVGICYQHGVTAMVHRRHTDSVLTSGSDIGESDLVEITLNPWDPQDRVLKRTFDITFASVGLLLLSPVMLVIAAAVKFDSPGPVLYAQERTAEFGETFEIYKFRSMVSDAEAATGPKLSDEGAGNVDPRVTRVGRALRQTHLDEVPQLWSILVGDMSVVGPRPERPELDADIEAGVSEWSRRWFVKPGLTGLAQINGVTGHQPEQKLRYDLEYIQRRSFWFDMKIVIRQIWLVFVDIGRILGVGDKPEIEREGK